MTTWAALVRKSDNSIAAGIFDTDALRFLADPDRPGARLVNGAVEIGWESETFLVAAAVPVKVPEGKQVTDRSLVFADGTVTETLTLEDVPVERRQVLKSTIVARLRDDQLTAALAAMTTRQKEQWYASDKPAIYADDEATVELLTAIGADPDSVLAE
jgi:hypothetical protein